MGGNNNQRYEYLSHRIDSDTPMYGNDGSVRRERLKEIDRGDTANVERWSLNNHTGTHIDFPRHFYNDGRTLNDYLADYFVVDSVHWLDLSPVCRPGLIIGPEHIEGYSIPEYTEALLLKTDFEVYRGGDTYWRENPGYAPELADHLRQHCPALRFVGFDSISLTSFTNRQLGREAHRAFLGGECPILLIEDMHLTSLVSGTQVMTMTVAPVQLNQADGTPATILAKLE